MGGSSCNSDSLFSWKCRVFFVLLLLLYLFSFFLRKLDRGGGSVIILQYKHFIQQRYKLKYIVN